MESLALQSPTLAGHSCSEVCIYQSFNFFKTALLIRHSFIVSSNFVNMANIFLIVDCYFFIVIIDAVACTFQFMQHLFGANCVSDTVLGHGSAKMRETRFLSWKSLQSSRRESVLPFPFKNLCLLNSWEDKLVFLVPSPIFRSFCVCPES